MPNMAHRGDTGDGPIRLIQEMPVYELRGSVIYRRTADRTEVLSRDLFRAMVEEGQALVAQMDVEERAPIPFDQGKRKI